MILYFESNKKTNFKVNFVQDLVPVPDGDNENDSNMAPQNLR